MKKIWALIGSILLLSSCAPVISSEVNREADKQLSFQELLKNPTDYKGKIVIFGGRIIGTTTKNGETWVEVLQQPLGWRQKPKSSDVSYGRFLVRYTDYRDLEIYQKGRLITVAGQVEGKKELQIDKLDYTYPVIVPRESHIWEPGEASKPQFHFGVGIGIGL